MKKNYVKITFLGDIMCSIPQLIHSKIGEDQYDFNPIFERISEYLHESDYVCANLETPLGGHDLNYTSETTLFNTPVDFAKAVKTAGIHMVTTSNNHCLDRGVEGLKRTIDNLNKIGLEYTGTYKYVSDTRFLVKDFKGLKVAFLSYTYGTDSEFRNNILLNDEEHCVNIFNTQIPFPILYKRSKLKDFLKLVTPEIIRRLARNSTYSDCGTIKDFNSPNSKRLLGKMSKDIHEAKKQADIVIMCLHIGGQYNSTIGDYTKLITSHCIGEGCDYVIGNHPHCVLEADLKPDFKLIAYSLGNFSFTPNWGYYVKGVYSDYSIILSLVFDTNTHKITKIPFSISKTIRHGDHSEVRLVNDIYSNLELSKEKSKLFNDSYNVICRFLGKKINNFSIQKEYDLLTM